MCETEMAMRCVYVIMQRFQTITTDRQAASLCQSAKNISQWATLICLYVKN